MRVGPERTHASIDGEGDAGAGNWLVVAVADGDSHRAQILLSARHATERAQHDN